MRKLTLLPIAPLLVAACSPSTPQFRVEVPAPPPTRVAEVADTLYNEVVPDPYRWLEDGDAPETRTWIDAQNAYTNAIFAQLPEKEELTHLATSLLSVDVMDSPVEKGGRYFYGKRRAGDDLMAVYYRDGYDGEEHVLIDPHGMSEDHSISVSVPQPLNCPECRLRPRLNDISADGSLMVYAVRQGGARDIELRIRNVDAGRDLPDVLPSAYYHSVQITPDNTGLYYAVRGTAEPRVWYHRLGTDVSEDREIFGAGYGMADIPYAELSPDGKWLLAGAWRGNTRTIEVHLKDLENDSEWIAISTEGMTIGGFAGDRLLLATTIGVETGSTQAPSRTSRYRVVVAPLDRPQMDHWIELIPAREDVAVRGTAGVGGHYFVGYTKDGQPRVAQYDTTGDLVREVEFGAMGSVFGPAGEWDKTEAFAVFTSFHVPTTEYRLDVNTGEAEVWFTPDVPVDPEAIQIQRVHFTAKDGLALSMFIVHEKGLDLDRDRPTFLVGYPGGAYSPAFWPEAVLFMEMGGVFALASPRGAGTPHADSETGIAIDWGSQADDFIAAAEYLIEEGYTRPERLVAMGRSMGGLMTANAIIRRPDLFGVVECGHPVTDMIRYHLSPAAAVLLGRLGTSGDPAQFQYIRRHSPYHNAVDGTRYPATVFITSDDDPLDPMHARKMTAIVQATNGGESPIMLRHQIRAGHGNALPLNEAIEAKVDLWAFYRWRVGAERN